MSPPIVSVLDVHVEFGHCDPACMLCVRRADRFDLPSSRQLWR